MLEGPAENGEDDDGEDGDDEAIYYFKGRSRRNELVVCLAEMM